MTAEIIVGIFSLGGALIGGLCSIVATSIGNKRTQIKADLADLADQVISYWNLENEYVEAFHDLDPEKRASKTIKEDFREIVQSKGLERPKMTHNTALSIKKRWHV